MGSALRPRTNKKTRVQDERYIGYMVMERKMEVLVIVWLIELLTLLRFVLRIILLFGFTGLLVKKEAPTLPKPRGWNLAFAVSRSGAGVLVVQLDRK